MFALVTGGSGYVGAHCIRQLLSQGHRVRTTVRSPQREDAVRAMLPPGADVSFTVADLTSDDGWAKAAVGCDALLHVTSPFPGSAPKHPDELIVPAREGTLRELLAARNAGVRRTVPVYVAVVEQLLNGKLPVLPKANWGVVDVRDVADIHVRAMVDPAAAGERFLATAGATTLPRIASLLRAKFGPTARRVPTRTVPDWLVRLGARVSPRFATLVPDLGVAREASSAKASEVLGWRPRPIEQTVSDTANSLAELGLLRDMTGKPGRVGAA